MAPDKRDELYNNLINSGKVTENEIGTIDDFKAAITDEATAKEFHQNLLSSGIFTISDIGDAADFWLSIRDDFNQPTAATQPTAQQQTQRNMGTPGVVPNRFGLPTQQGMGPVADVAPHPMTPAQPLSFQERVQKSVGMAHNVGKAKADFSQRMSAIDQGNKPFSSGKSQQYDPTTGETKDVYYTTTGQAVSTPMERDIANIDNSPQGRIGKELEDAYAERDRLEQELSSRSDEVNADGTSTIAKLGAGTLLGLTPAGVLAPELAKQMDKRIDPQWSMLNAAKRANDKRIAILERDRDRDGFFRAVGKTLFDIDTWDFGANEIADAVTLSAAADKKLTGKAGEAQEALMRNTYLKQIAEQRSEDDTFMQRAGDITANAIPFVLEFILTGGGYAAIGAAGRRLGAKAAAKIGAKGFAAWTMKNTGTLAGNMLSGLLMANTTGLGRTAADIMGRHQGVLTQDENGDYVFRDGKSWGRSVYEGEMAQAIEYFTEHLGNSVFDKALGKWVYPTAGKLLTKGLDKLGASKVSEIFSRMSNSQWVSILDKAGIQGYPSEVLEEGASIVLNSLLVGDNQFSDLWDRKTLADILGGMALSIGFMQAPGVARGAYNTAQYYRFKHNTDKSDQEAAKVMGEQWEGMRDLIDNTPNEGMQDVIEHILDSPLPDDYKATSVTYAYNLMKLRGYNLRTAANAKDRMADTDENGEPRAMSGEETAENEAYANGYEADEQQRSDISIEREDNPNDPQAQAAWQGVEDRIRQDAADRADQRRAEGERMAYKGKGDMQGAIRPLTINEESTERDPQTGERKKKTVYLVNGNIAIEPNGNGLSREGTDKTIYVYDPETGEAHELDPFGGAGVLSVGDVVSMEDYLADNEQQGQAEVQQEIDNATGKVNIQPNTPFVTPEDRQGIVKSVEGDNVIVQFADGEMEEASIPLADMQQYADALRRQEYEARHPQESGDNVANGLNGEQAPTAAGQAPMATTETPTEGEQAAADTRTPAQRTYDDMTAKYGEKASHKVDVTLKDRKATLDTKKKALDKAQADYDDAPIGKEDKAEAALTKAQEEYDNALADYNAWDEVRKLRDQALLAQAEQEEQQRKAELERKRAEETEAQRKQREEYEAEQARRKAEAEAAEKRRQEENERLKQQAANPQPAEQPAPIEGTKGQASQLAIARQELADDPGALAMLEDMEPTSLEEVAAMLLTSGKGQVKLLRDDFMAHTGYSSEDVKRYPFIFAGKEKGGITLAQFGEKVIEEARDYNIPLDDNDAMVGVNAVLNMLSSVGRQSDINDYVAMNRIRMAYDYHNAALAEARARMLEAYGMTEGEYEAYMSWLEDAIEQGKSTLSDEEFNQLFNVYEQGQTTDVARGNQEGAETTERPESAETDVSKDGERGNGETDAGTAEVSKYEEAESAFFGFLEWTNWEYGTNYDWNSLMSFLKWANKKAKAKNQPLRKFVHEWIVDKYPPKDAAELTDKIFAALKEREDTKKAETAQQPKEEAEGGTETAPQPVGAATAQDTAPTAQDTAQVETPAAEQTEGTAEGETEQYISGYKPSKKVAEFEKESNRLAKQLSELEEQRDRLSEQREAKRKEIKGLRGKKREEANAEITSLGESIARLNEEIDRAEDESNSANYVYYDARDAELYAHLEKLSKEKLEALAKQLEERLGKGTDALFDNDEYSAIINVLDEKSFEEQAETPKQEPKVEKEGEKREGGSEKTEKYRDGESIKDYTQRNGDYLTTREQYMKQKYGERYNDMANVMSGINAENAREKGRQIGALLETDGNGLDEAQALLSVFKADAPSTMPFFDGVVEGKAEQPKAAVGEKEEQSGKGEKVKNEAAPKQKIDDVGEKIGGARKDLAQKMGAKINLDADTFPKMFPKFDLKKAVEQGLDTKLASAVYILRIEAQQSYKSRLKHYSKENALSAAKFWAAYAKQFLENGNTSTEFKDSRWTFTEYGKKHIEYNLALYEKVYEKFGNTLFDLDFSGYTIRPVEKNKWNHYYRKNEQGKEEEYQPAYEAVAGYSSKYYTDGELDKAIDELVNRMAESVSYKESHPYKLSHYYTPGVANSHYVGVKLGGKVVALTEKMGDKETSKYLKEHEAELQEKAKRLDEERKQSKQGGTNTRWKPELGLGGGRARVGNDYRNGKDVSAEDFRKTFGFRGVEFGNYVTQAERQRFINEAYDAMMDLAALLNVSPRALSLGGRLGFAIGARGGGNAVAHYEPDMNVINLTKSKGAGSLAHEWWHALDYYFNRMGDYRKTPATANKRAEDFNPGHRAEMANAFVSLMEKINGSDYRKRSVALDAALNKDYYTNPTELGARAFQDYVQRRLTDRGQINDFLSSFTPEEQWNGKAETYPYPTGKDADAIDERFDNLFGTMLEREDEQGNVMLYERADGKAARVSAKERKLRDAIVDLLRNKAGIDVVTESEEGQRVLDMANGRERQHRVYHGSGADFEAFDHTHMGEGEGAQAFGWGTYVTEVEGIGKRYAEKANEKNNGVQVYHDGERIDQYDVFADLYIPENYAANIIFEQGNLDAAVVKLGQSIEWTLREIQRIANDNSKINLLESYNSELNRYREALDLLLDGKWQVDNREEQRILYEVEIPEDNWSNYLEWDKKASDKQTEAIKSALMQNEAFVTNLRNEYDSRNEWTDKPPFEEWLENVASVTSMYGKENGKRLYNELSNMMGSEQAVSEFLHSAGFVGIKYPAEYYSGGRADNAKNYVIFDEGDLQITDKVKFFRTENGDAYGFTMGGKIYLDPRIATAETPIHEYTHLWAEALRQANPKAWEQLKSELEKDKDLMAYVQRLYPELKGDELMDEVFAHFSGRRGAERLRAEQERMEGETRSIVGKAKVIAMFENLRNALKRFWNAARDLFAGKSVKNESAEGFADMVLADLVGGFKPDRVDRLDRNDRERDAEYMEAVESGDMEKAQRMVNEAAKRAMPDTKVVDENDNPLVVYHGGKGKIIVFDKNRIGENLDYGTMGAGFYFTSDRENAENYARNAKGEEEPSVERVFINIRNIKEVNWNELDGKSKKKSEAFTAKAIAKGYDGLTAYAPNRAWWYVAFDPSQIKSADPVTYDDNGNVIPLSERFNSGNADIRYQRGATDSDVRFRSSTELFEQYPTWLSGQTTSTGQHTTQITSTVKTYQRIGDWMQSQGMEGAKVLDASSGLGAGTQALRDMGFDVEDVEPYPSENREAPTYTRYEDVNGKYDVVISNAVLNVIPDDWRADVLRSMADKVKEGGKLIINVRDAKSIESQKQKIELDSPSEILVTDSKGNIRAYQKGFTKSELKAYVESELGEGWQVEIANEGNSGVKSGTAVVVTRGEGAEVPNYRKPADMMREGGEEANAGEWYDRNSVERIGEFAGYTPKQIAKMNARQEESARKQFNDAAEKLHLSDNITFADTIDDVPGLTDEQRSEWRRKKGWYSPRTGKIVIILGNHKSMDDVMKSILHEGVAHHGLRQMFGEHFNTFLDNVYRVASPEIRDRINAMAKKHGWDFREATEEYLAMLAEDTDFERPENQSWWKQVKEWFIDLLHKIGFKLHDAYDTITDNELRYILWRSYENLVHPGRYNSVVEEAKDVAKQYDLKVGRWDETWTAAEAEPNATIEYNGRRIPIWATNGQRNDINKGGIKPSINLNEIAEIKAEAENDGFVAGIGIDMTMTDGNVYHLWVGADKEEEDYETTDFYPQDYDDDIPNEEMTRRFGKFFGENVNKIFGSIIGGHIMTSGRRGFTLSHDEIMRMGGVRNNRNGSDYNVAADGVAEDAAEYAKETERIEQEARANGTWMKAPNGKRSNLDKERWVMVRTKSFKKWFGDWQNDPENASRVVDENGEPRVVYHGSRVGGFSVFADGEKQSDAPEGSYFFSSKESVAYSYSGSYQSPIYKREVDEDGYEDDEKYPSVYACFLNIREPVEEDFEGASWEGDVYDKVELRDDEDEIIYNPNGSRFFDSYEEAEEYAEDNGYKDYEIYENPYIGYSVNGVVREAQNIGADGAIIYNIIDSGSHGADEEGIDYVAFNPSQIKSADPVTYDNNGNVIPLSQRFNEGSDDIRFRDGEDDKYAPKAQAAGLYERAMNDGWNQFTEAMQDSMMSVKKLVMSVLEARGEKGKKMRIEDVAGYENPWLAENRLRGSIKNQVFAWQRDYMEPLQKAIYDITGGIKPAYDELMDYMMAKHGLERNEVLAKRDAKKAWEEQNKSEIGNPNYTTAKNAAFANIDAGVDDLYLEQRKKDYAGLTALTGKKGVKEAEKEAQRMVDEYEKRFDTTKLWEATNRATRSSLFTMLECGMMTPARHAEIRDMFKYYIPLQGFDSDVAEDVYAYMGSDGTRLYGTAIRAAKGRKSKADDPIATIAMNGEAAIRRGNRNLMKQHFLRFVQAHPSDLVSINDVWLRKNANGEWEQYFDADLKETDTPEEVADKVRDFNERMEQESAANPDIYKRSRDLPNVPFRVLNTRDMKQHQVMVQVNGKNYLLTVNGNPRAAQALNGLSNPDVFTESVFGKAMNIAQSVTRELSQFYTTRKPSFVLSNFSRDSIYTNLIVGVKEDKEYSRAFHKNWANMNPATMGKLFSEWVNGKLRNKILAGTATDIERMFNDFLMYGGETGWISMRDIERQKKDLQKALKQEGNTAAQKWKSFWATVDLANRAVENCARFAAFITSQQMGRSIERSVWDAKEISVNFEKKGAGDKFLGSKNQTVGGWIGAVIGGWCRGNYAFWNAGVQGISNFYRAAKKKPGKFALRIFAMNFTLGMMAPLISALLGGDDDDENNYFNLPEYKRRNNLCFRFTKHMPWITIPLPIEFRAIYGLGELAMCHMLGKEHFYNGWDCAKAYMQQLSQVLPLDFLEGGGGWHVLLPTYAKPAAEAYANESWTGLPIYKENTYGQYNDLPEWQRAYPNTNMLLVNGTRWINEATVSGDLYTGGNDEDVKGFINWNPARIEYMLRGYLGGYYSMYEHSAKTISTIWGNREFEWRNIPLAHVLITEGDERTAERSIKNEYYKIVDDYEKTDHKVSQYDEKAHTEKENEERRQKLNTDKRYLRHEIVDIYKTLIDKFNDTKKDADEEEKKAIEEYQAGLRKEMVDMVHNLESKSKSELEKSDNLGQIDELAEQALGSRYESGDLSVRKSIGSITAKRIGKRYGSQARDSYGSGSALDTEYGKIYEKHRTYTDMAGDIMLNEEIKRATAEKDYARLGVLEGAKKDIADRRDDLNQYITKEGIDNIMEDIRRIRRKALYPEQAANPTDNVEE